MSLRGIDPQSYLITAMPNLVRLTVLVVALMSAQIAVAGAFSKKTGYGPGECHPMFAAGCYVITGEITQSDYIAIERLIAEIIKRKSGTPIFTLNSNGGNMIAAMDIGRLLRKARALASVSEQDTCLSACVLILAGATQRTASGVVGIHRPYSTALAGNYSDAQSAYRQSGELVKRYLQEMNLSDSLYEAMVRVPPEKIRTLTQSELTEFGLSQIDPVEQDVGDSYDAKKYGLSRQELLQRKNRIDAVCSSFLLDERLHRDYVQCREQVMRGVR